MITQQTPNFSAALLVLASFSDNGRDGYAQEIQGKQGAVPVVTTAIQEQVQVQALGQDNNTNNSDPTIISKSQLDFIRLRSSNHTTNAEKIQKLMLENWAGDIRRIQDYHRNQATSNLEQGSVENPTLPDQGIQINPSSSVKSEQDINNRSWVESLPFGGFGVAAGILIGYVLGRHSKKNL